ncbi:unnamed protein product [Polarella glacialis]|uniref:Uncharacterized protein n=1 Tax=Polarella glacialis TaxID=89957 RepID=A0A813HJ53_POLGL|nr:unnamed protein product [Polarella glacialis]
MQSSTLHATEMLGIFGHPAKELWQKTKQLRTVQQSGGVRSHMTLDVLGAELSALAVLPEQATAIIYNCLCCCMMCRDGVPAEFGCDCLPQAWSWIMDYI